MIAPRSVVLVREGHHLLQGAWVFPWVWKNGMNLWGRFPWETGTFEGRQRKNPAEAGLEHVSVEPCPLHV
ncbi:hypothetical protein M405DRAFT_249671 [Rhizopogon salebrosus TDB-379]|nr:hypothetical protein M405DRAFT_249671 [Rhizopogon salebrosus TDB-379]